MKKFTLLCGLIICIHFLSFNRIHGQMLTTPFDSIVQTKGTVLSVNVFKAVSENGVIAKGEKVTELTDFSPEALSIREIGFDAIFLPEGDLYAKDSIADYYDQKGRCIRRCFFYPDGKLKESRTFSYDGTGVLTSCIIRRTDEETVDAISYSYDPYGYLALKVFHRKGEGIYQQRYAYDKSGNWIVRVDFREDEPVYYIERNILYSE